MYTDNDIQRMLTEYVTPAIALLIIGTAIACVLSIPVGRAIDKEIAFEQNIINQYKK